MHEEVVLIQHGLATGHAAIATSQGVGMRGTHATGAGRPGTLIRGAVVRVMELLKGWEEGIRVG